MSATLCLNMIVKNESHVVAETLENICQNFKLDYWVISDTGSTDNTIQIIEDFFKAKGIAGEIQQEPWQDFGYNRNKALEACTNKTDYVLFFDADDRIEGQLNLPPLGEYDGYHFQFTNEQYALRYTRRLIVKNNGLYRWRGVLHEFIESRQPVKEIVMNGDYLVISCRKGSRNLDPKKALNDALVLEKAFAKEEDLIQRSRYAFYCANSYRSYAVQDDQYISHSIEWYKKRAEILLSDHVDDERYMCYDSLGVIYEEQKQYDQAIYYWHKGIGVDPKRAECWFRLARAHRAQGNLDLAYCFAQQAIKLEMPTGERIFINSAIYKFWALYELWLIECNLNLLEPSYLSFKRLMPTFRAEYVPTIHKVMLLYVPLIWQDTYQNVAKLKNDFAAIGAPNYIDDLLTKSCG